MNSKTDLRLIVDKAEDIEVVVKFPNAKTYKYNCEFDAKIGDFVYVEGSMYDILGEVIDVDKNYFSSDFNKEVIKLFRPENSLHYQGFDYLITQEKNIKIIGCNLYDNDVIDVPESINGFKVVEIANRVFFDDRFLHIKEIKLPVTLEIIGRNFYIGYQSDKNNTIPIVKIPKNVKYIGELFISDLDKFSIDSQNPHFKTKYGFLLSGDGRVLLRSVYDHGDLIIPESVSEIPDDFKEYRYIRELIIPLNVKKIGKNFLNYKNIKLDEYGIRYRINIQLPNNRALSVFMHEGDSMAKNIISCFRTMENDFPFDLQSYDEYILKATHTETKIKNIAFRLINDYELKDEIKKEYIKYLIKMTVKTFSIIFKLDVSPVTETFFSNNENITIESALKTAHEYNVTWRDGYYKTCMDEEARNGILMFDFWPYKKILDAIEDPILKHKQEFVKSANDYLTNHFDLEKIALEREKRIKNRITPIEAFDYIELDNNTIEISKYYGDENPNKSIVIVPDEIEGKKVTRVGANSFLGASMKEVVLPKYLTHIDEKSFYSCNKLIEVNTNDLIEYIGNSAFELCEKLQVFHFPKTLRFIGSEAFTSSPLNFFTTDGIIELEYMGYNNYALYKKPNLSEKIQTYDYDALRRIYRIDKPFYIMEKYKVMLDKGIINEDEYKKMCKKIREW
jgi:hypothetical protein